MMISIILFSLYVAIASVSVSFILGIFFAEILSVNNSKFLRFLEFILLFPLILPPTVLGFYLILLLGNNGIIANFFHVSVNILFSPLAIIIVGVIVSIPIMYRTIKISFESIPTAIIDASKLDAISKLDVLLFVKMPLAYKGIFAGILLSFLRVLGEFGASLMVSGNISGYTQTIPQAIWELVMNNDFHSAHLLTLFLIIFSISLVVLINFLDIATENNSIIIDKVFRKR
jgi:molybdate transport system permease protein